jgi:hypothetical protein
VPYRLLLQHDLDIAIFDLYWWFNTLNVRAGCQAFCA